MPVFSKKAPHVACVSQPALQGNLAEQVVINREFEVGIDSAHSEVNFPPPKTTFLADSRSDVWGARPDGQARLIVQELPLFINACAVAINHHDIESACQDVNGLLHGIGSQ